MTLCCIRSTRILENHLATRRSSSYLNKNFEGCRAKHATLASLAVHGDQGSVNQAARNQAHLGLMTDLRYHFQKAGVATEIGILHALRQWYPDHFIVQTPKSTGLLKFAKVGQASARLDSSTEEYSSRYFKFSSDPAKAPGRLKDDVQLVKYDYEWDGRQFQLYATEYNEKDYGNVHNHYILCPKEEAEIVSGRSKVVDKLIVAATLHGSSVDEEIWVYDRGYWKKSHKLWQAVHASKWEQVILSSEMKAQLVDDVEGFFDRKQDYESFAVPWKVCQRSELLFSILCFWCQK